MSLSLQRLKYFHAIAKSTSITKAADVLNIAQPALSYQLAAIERELGTRLLERSNTGVTLTMAGKILFQRTSSIFRELDDTENEIRETVRLPHGIVTLALAVTMARQLVPPLLRIVDRSYPLVQLKILDVPSLTAFEIMRTGNADLALVPNAADMDDCEAIPAYRERLCFITRSDPGPPVNRPIRFSRIADEPLVLSGRTYDLRKRAEEAAIACGVTLNIRYEQESQDIVRAIVLEELAGTITQAALFDPHTERPRLNIRPLFEPEISRTHAIVRRGGLPSTLAQEAIIDALLLAISALVADRVFPGSILPRPSRSFNA